MSFGLYDHDWVDPDEDEIVYCRDCVYFEQPPDANAGDYGFCRSSIQEEHELYWMKPDDYCEYGGVPR